MDNKPDRKLNIDDLEKKVSQIMHSNILSSGDDNLPERADKLKVTFDDVTKTYLPPEAATKLSNLTPEDKKKLLNGIIDFSNKSRYRVGRICKGTECNTYKDCPFTQLGNGCVPEGYRCPMELVEIDKIYTKYYNMLVHEYHVDESLVDMYLRELIILEINIQRVNEHIAERGLMESTPIFGFPKSEQIVNGKIASPLYDVLEKLLRRRDIILKALAITPEARLKYRMRNDSDLAKLLAEFKKRSSDAAKRSRERGYDQSAEVVAVQAEDGEEHATG